MNGKEIDEMTLEELKEIMDSKEYFDSNGFGVGQVCPDEENEQEFDEVIEEPWYIVLAVCYYGGCDLERLTFATELEACREAVKRWQRGEKFTWENPPKFACKECYECTGIDLYYSEKTYAEVETACAKSRSKKI